jgi:hypothetical protein
MKKKMFPVHISSILMSSALVGTDSQSDSETLIPWWALIPKHRRKTK